MEKSYFISIYLDTRRPKTNGKCPVKLRVFTRQPRIQKLYPSSFEFTKKEFDSVWISSKPGQEHKQLRYELQAIEKTANDTAKALSNFTFEEFEKKLFRKSGQGKNVFYQYELLIDHLKNNIQLGTASNYNLSLKSIKSYLKHATGKEQKALYFSDITPSWLQKYERFMVEEPNNRSFTTVSMYLRALRTVFNTAISEKEIDIDLYPFGKRKYQIPAVRNVKKALSKEQLKQLFESKAKTSEQQKAKDFWFFSYSCNGMNIKDIALLKYKDLQDDKMIFYRAKTIKTSKTDLKPITVYLTDFAKEVIKKYGNANKKSGNLIFPIISESNSGYSA